MNDCCVLVCVLFHPEEPLNRQISHQPFGHVCMCFNFVKVFFSNPCQGRFEKINFTKIEANAGMAERLVIDLAIEEALQEEIKDTLECNNQYYGEWCAQTNKGKNNNKVKLTVTYDMGWQKR